MSEYKRAVELQPGYVTAWNNLGDAYEKLKSWRWGHIQSVCEHVHSIYKNAIILCAACREALAAYSEALTYAPNNSVAQQRAEFCRGKIERMSTTAL